MIRAVKCRYCGEFLNTRKAKHLLQPLVGDDEDEQVDEEIDVDEMLFEAHPSLFAMAPQFLKGSIGLAVAWAVAAIPIEQYLNVWFKMELATSLLERIGRYRLTAGLGLAAMVLTLISVKLVKLRMIYYEITPDRIEWSRGIFDRRVDNLDMFRVLDLKLYRSLFDCIVGTGTVALMTNDKSDPDFVFEKVRRPRQLYDIIKKASLEADRRNSVIHLE